MRAVEGDDGVRGGLEGCACFIFHQEGMEISTETVAEEEEASEATDGGGMNWTLIVNREFEAGKVGVDTGAEGDGKAIAFGDGACGAIEVLEDAVYGGGSYVGVDSCPDGCVDGSDHV